MRRDVERVKSFIGGFFGCPSVFSRPGFRIIPLRHTYERKSRLALESETMFSAGGRDEEKEERGVWELMGGCGVDERNVG